jgi:hypothetical protein
VVEYREDASTGNKPVLVVKAAALAQQFPPLALYPNPVVEELRVDGTTESLPYQITTSEGALLEKGVLTPERAIPVRHLPPGMYFLRARRQRLAGKYLEVREGVRQG